MGARFVYKRWQVAGLLLTAGAVATGLGAAARWCFPDTKTAIVGTWVRDPRAEPSEGYTFAPQGRYERGPMPGGARTEVGRYEVSRNGGSVRLIPDSGREYRISLRFEGRNQFNLEWSLPTGETVGEPYFRK